MEGTIRVVLFSACLLLAVSATEKQAVCRIAKDSGDVSHPIEGTILLTQEGDGDTTIKVNLKGFVTEDASAKHGFHIHEKGDLGNKCADAKGHYNPDGVDHAGPTDDPRHVGDLGNIEENAQGEVSKTITDNKVMLSGDRSVIGRAFVVHLLEDDLGKGTGDKAEESKKTGNAGARIACCKIEEMVMAKCEIEASSGNASYPITGSVKFSQAPSGGPTTIVVDLAGFPTTDGAKHGFHIHQEGELTNGCADAKGHYNPFNMTHGVYTDTNRPRHVGDLGNVEVSGEKVQITIVDDQVSLVGDDNVMDRAIVVHALEDDLGLVDNDGSKTTGNAGSRVACCKIVKDDDATDGATLQQLHPRLLAAIMLLFMLLRL